MMSPGHRLIAAIPYPEGIYPDQLFRTMCDEFRSRGERLAGVIQRDVAVPGRPCCDMMLDDLSSGVAIAISEYRGPEAKGCQLDSAGLARAAAAITDAIDRDDPTLIVINKFGKVESGGGGLLDVIGRAASRGIPVIVGVPERNMNKWLDFVGDLSEVVPSDLPAIMSWRNRLLLSAA